MPDQIVLSHISTVNACGFGLAQTFEALCQNRSGLRPYDFGGPPLDTFIGRVPGVEELAFEKSLGVYDCRNNRLAQMALEADDFAQKIEKAKGIYGSDRIAVIMGTSTSGVGEGEAAYLSAPSDGSPLPGSFKFDQTHDFFSLPRFVSAYLGLEGPSITVSAACASSNKVFADAWQWLEAGLCDAAVVGGVDSLCHLTLRGFNSLELLSKGPCRPGDEDRSGISIGEAAGFALLERDANPPSGTVTLRGYGESSDAYHMSSPHPEGKGAAMAMQAALQRAALSASDIDYINLHGTGSAINDKVEDQAVFELFGADTPTSSTKAWTGHALGAAGITEVIISCLSLREGFLPGTQNLRNPDPAFKSHLLAESKRQPLSHVLTNSFGFGGNNCSLILGRAP
ncbi:MAG: beta-ketoacyl-[acyl-carrier-protein] synthase family protein [Pseudomonadota bacterium]